MNLVLPIRPNPRFVALGATLFLALLAAPVSTRAETPRPNFVFILSDDHGWSQSSAAMHPEIAESRCDYFETPNIERLAREGMRFSSGYAPASNCTPTRRSLLCGMTTARQRGTEFRSRFNPADHLTIPRALKSADPSYRTAHLGKWGENMVATPEESGYDESDGETGNRTGGVDPGVVFTAEEDTKLTFSLTRRAGEFMERQTEEGTPFYLQVSYYALHRQIQARPETIEKYEGKGPPPRSYPRPYAAMAEDMDSGIGELLEKIDALGIADNTYVIFAADNGGAEHFPQNPAYVSHLGMRPPRRTDFTPPEGVEQLPSNHPLRGAKNNFFEGGLRVPFIVRGPGVAADSWSHEPVVLYDLLPTLHELAGGTNPLPETIDGGSFVPLLNGEEATIERPAGGLVFHRPFARRPAGGQTVYRSGDLKLVLNWADDETELYNLVEDIGERKDLAESMPEETERLRARLLDYLGAVDAESPDSDDPTVRRRKAQ